MKRILLTVAAIATSLLTITGCTKPSAGILANANPPNGAWIITYYNDGGELIMSDYADYVFNFNGNNVVRVTNNDRELSGYWALSAEDRRQEFNIAFNNGDDKLSHINDDWEVLSFSESEIVLTEDGDEIHFRKQPTEATTDSLVRNF